MTVLTHTVSISSQHGHDWVALGVQIIAPLGSTIVALFAVSFSYIQARQSHAIADRQATTEENKLRSELYQRRFDAWAELSDSADACFKSALHCTPEDVISGRIDIQPRLNFTRATGKLYFLFGDDANEAVNSLSQALNDMLSAKAGLIDTTSPVAVANWGDSIVNCERAKAELKVRLQKYIRLPL